MKKVLLTLTAIAALTAPAFAEEELKRHPDIVGAINALKMVNDDLMTELNDVMKKGDADKALEIGEHVFELKKAVEILHAAEHYHHATGKADK